MLVNGADPAPPRSLGRRRLRAPRLRLALAGPLVLVALFAAACTSSTESIVLERAVPQAAPSPDIELEPTATGASESGDPAESFEESATEGGTSGIRSAEGSSSDSDAPSPTPTPKPAPTPHPLAEADTELPPAPIGFDSLFAEEPAGPAPVSIVIEGIGVRDAAVIPVGVNEDLTFEVPPAEQVGWYEFGPSPGQAGSAVLAAHIAYNGVDGVFRYLSDVEVGSVVVVGFDDGSSRRYRIETVTDYFKEALPDSLFARDGREQLALITCGGSFNYDLDSYDSNTVAVAVPI